LGEKKAAAERLVKTALSVKRAAAAFIKNGSLQKIWSSGKRQG
jgi:hypothetical protein